MTMKKMLKTTLLILTLGVMGSVMGSTKQPSFVESRIRHFEDLSKGEEIHSFFQQKALNLMVGYFSISPTEHLKRFQKRNQFLSFISLDQNFKQSHQNFLDQFSQALIAEGLLKELNTVYHDTRETSVLLTTLLELVKQLPVEICQVLPEPNIEMDSTKKASAIVTTDSDSDDDGLPVVQENTPVTGYAIPFDPRDIKPTMTTEILTADLTPNNSFKTLVA
jgi:hypothetical protein